MSFRNILVLTGALVAVSACVPHDPGPNAYYGGQRHYGVNQQQHYGVNRPQYYPAQYAPQQYYPEQPYYAAQPQYYNGGGRWPSGTYDSGQGSR